MLDRIIIHKNFYSGQEFAQQLQDVNPDLIESLRRQMGGNQNDPDPPQQN